MGREKQNNITKKHLKYKILQKVRTQGIWISDWKKLEIFIFISTITGEDSLSLNRAWGLIHFVSFSFRFFFSHKVFFLHKPREGHKSWEKQYLSASTPEPKSPHLDPRPFWPRVAGRLNMEWSKPWFGVMSES